MSSEWLASELDAKNDRILELVKENQRLRAGMYRIINIDGCECDHGHTCALCRVREIARKCECG